MSIGSIEMTGDAVWSLLCLALHYLSVVSPSLESLQIGRVKMVARILTYTGVGSTILIAAAPFLPSNSMALDDGIVRDCKCWIEWRGRFYNALSHLGEPEDMDRISTLLCLWVSWRRTTIGLPSVY